MVQKTGECSRYDRKAVPALFIENKTIKMGANITLITGGQRSGKSSFARELAEKNSSTPVFLATARVWDEEFRKRIERHQSDRDSRWSTFEEEKNLALLNLSGQTVLLDCITLWLNNFFHDCGFDPDKARAEAQKEWDSLIRQDTTLIVVSNELGMGIIPENEAARKFIDLQGWMNQHIARSAQTIYWMISGIPVKIKG
ncbi:MAG TPA: bifunctional adenosylcobinamide kinase/adenosylcobinamide-phosphate guanylyltransferase [Prolixibacteraceae bacterium]|nr:bifunctional adenosylcobinamide kinase/adenosylcobinamide-phosphate guanylyltransferase [Prolixibacteraceae bacterium]